MQYLINFLVIVFLFMLIFQSIKETKKLENAVKTKLEIMQRIKIDAQDTIGLSQADQILKEHGIDNLQPCY